MENRDKNINSNLTNVKNDVPRIKPSSIRPNRSIYGVKSIKPTAQGPTMQQQVDQPK